MSEAKQRHRWSRSCWMTSVPTHRFWQHGFQWKRHRWLLVTITNPQCTNCLTQQKFSRCPTKRQRVKPQKWMATQPDPDYAARTPQVDQYLACLGQYQITQLADRVNGTWQRSFLSPPPRNNESINQQWIWLTVSSPYFMLPRPTQPFILLGSINE